MNRRIASRSIVFQLFGFALGCCLALCSASASAVVVAFDDLSLPANTPIPDGYGGINWTTSPLIGFLLYPQSPDPSHPLPTPPNVAYPRNGFDGGPVSFQFLTPEVFNGAYFYAIADTCGGLCPSPVPVTVKFEDRKSTRLNSSHPSISYAVFCLKKK